MRKRSPNLLYVFPEQFRQMALGLWQNEVYRPHLQGHPDPVSTPNIDRFAQQATLLPQAVSNCPVCSPHRGILLTGQYPNKSGVPLNYHSERLCSSLTEDARCLTDVLAEQGYSVGYIGKWHLDLPTPNAPNHPGPTALRGILTPSRAAVTTLITGMDTAPLTIIGIRIITIRLGNATNHKNGRPSTKRTRRSRICRTHNNNAIQTSRLLYLCR